DAGCLAHYVTVNRDGSPQASLVWVGFDGDELVSGHLHPNQKLRNVQRDPRVAVTLEAPRRPGVFLAEHAVLYGPARVVEGGAADLLQRLGKVYVGADFDFPLGAEPPAGYLLRMTIERIGGVGPWAKS